MTKPRGPLPELAEYQQAMFIESHPNETRRLMTMRRNLLVLLASEGWSHRMLAELYGVAHNTIRYWMRDPTEPARKRKR